MKSALVLIDEIDAHMHPAWQQSIIHHLQEKFPNIQVIATTHSPLIVAGRKGQEVTVFSRDPETGVVSAKRPKMDFKGMRSDQILTSPAFGLEGARDYDTTKTQSRYRYLLEKIDPTAEELAELDRLNEDEAIVATRIGETPIESETIEVLSESLDDALTRRSPEERAMLLREIDLQVKEAQFQSLNR